MLSRVRRARPALRRSLHRRRAHDRDLLPARLPRAPASARARALLPMRRGCRPDAAPGSPAQAGTSATVARALRLIADGAADGGERGVEVLAARLGVGARHLRRLFAAELGASPIAVAQTRRAHFARQLIAE